jgi:hypothetical protein
MDGSVEFYRNFSDYDNGFGNAEGELWLGMSGMILFPHIIVGLSIHFEVKKMNAYGIV